jgi:hypothetical protein
MENLRSDTDVYCYVIYLLLACLDENCANGPILVSAHLFSYNNWRIAKRILMQFGIDDFYQTVDTPQFLLKSGNKNGDFT